MAIKVHFLQDLNFQDRLYPAGAIVELDNDQIAAILETQPEAVALELEQAYNEKARDKKA